MIIVLAVRATLISNIDADIGRSRPSKSLSALNKLYFRVKLDTILEMPVRSAQPEQKEGLVTMTVFLVMLAGCL